MVSDTRATVESFIQAGEDGDTGRIVELTHPDCTVVVPSTLPYGGTYEGGQAFLEVFGAVYDVWETFDIELAHLLSEGSHAAAVYDTTMVPLGDDTELDMSLVEFYTVSDDQIVDARVYYQDTSRALAALD